MTDDQEQPKWWEGCQSDEEWREGLRRELKKNYEAMSPREKLGYQLWICRFMNRVFQSTKKRPRYVLLVWCYLRVILLAIKREL